mgnify:CR=1 FL=1
MTATAVQPRQVRLELTNKCNAHCASCHRLTMSREQGHMPWGLLEKCVEETRGWPQPLGELVPSHYGETWLYPRWLEALRLVAQRLPRTPIVIPTNGTLLTGDMVDQLSTVPTVRLINFSVNAALPSTYEAFHRLPASKMEVIEQAILRLRQRRPDITIWVSLVQDCQYQSPREVELFRERWSKYGVVQVNAANYNNRPDRQPLVPVTLPCRSIFSDLVVLWDGRVTSCCFDAQGDLVVGDATKDKLLDIWHGRPFAELRDKHTRGQRAAIPLCASCTFA